MNINYKDLLPTQVLDNIESFRGYVLIWRGHHKPIVDRKHKWMLLHRIKKLTPLGRHILLENYDIYENADKNQELVYIHNINSLESFKTLDLSDATKALDLSDINIPESYDILETSEKDIPQFPYTPLAPQLKVMKHSLKNTKYSLKDMKKIIAISLFCMVYHKHPSLNAFIKLMKGKGIINSVDELTEWVFRGMEYIGFKKYTAREAVRAIYNKHYFILHGCFKSINNATINYELSELFTSHYPDIIDDSNNIYYYNVVNDDRLHGIVEYIKSVYE